MTDNLNIEKLMTYKIPPARDDYDPRDAILYALGVGTGLSDKIDETSLLFERELQVLPTMALVGYVICPEIPCRPFLTAIPISRSSSRPRSRRRPRIAYPVTVTRCISIQISHKVQGLIARYCMGFQPWALSDGP